MKQYIRKADVILLIVLIAAGLAASAALAMQGGGSSAAKVVIKSNGAVYATYALDEDKTVIVPAPKQLAVDAPSPNSDDPASAQYDYYNIVTIDGGTVSVAEASCKNRVCVRHGSISKPGESIVCLPNRLVVSIESEKGGGYDSISS